jgi:hypothetical protein
MSSASPYFSIRQIALIPPQDHEVTHRLKTKAIPVAHSETKVTSGFGVASATSLMTAVFDDRIVRTQKRGDKRDAEAKGFLTD